MSPQPRVNRLYWLLQKLTEKDLSISEIDTPVSFSRLIHDFLLLKKMGFVSFKISSEGEPSTVHLYRLPDYEEVRSAYVSIKRRKLGVDLA